MDKKLTLSLNHLVIEKAKVYAKSHGTSLSKMIEAYFDSLTGGQNDSKKIRRTPLVESLCGVIDLPEDYDYREERAKYLLNKHKWPRFWELKLAGLYSKRIYSQI